VNNSFILATSSVENYYPDDVIISNNSVIKPTYLHFESWTKIFIIWLVS